MTKNEIIAGLLLEAADLLKNDPDQESLNEGAKDFVGAIGFMTLLTALGVWAGKEMVMDIKDTMRKNKEKKKLSKINKYANTYNLANSNIFKIISDAKFIKYKKGTIEYLEKIVDPTRQCVQSFNNFINELTKNYHKYSTGMMSSDEFVKNTNKMIQDTNSVHNKFLKENLEIYHNNVTDEWIDVDKSKLLSAVKRLISINTDINADKYMSIEEKIGVDEVGCEFVLGNDPDENKLSLLSYDYIGIVQIPMGKIMNSVKVQMKGKKLKW